MATLLLRLETNFLIEWVASPAHRFFASWPLRLPVFLVFLVKLFSRQLTMWVLNDTLVELLVILPVFSIYLIPKIRHLLVVIGFHGSEVALAALIDVLQLNLVWPLLVIWWSSGALLGLLGLVLFILLPMLLLGHEPWQAAGVTRAAQVRMLENLPDGDALLRIKCEHALEQIQCNWVGDTS